MTKKYKLPDGVKCIVGDGEFLYVGCNNGALYGMYGSCSFENNYYRPRSWEILYLVAHGRPSVHPFVCALLAEPFDL